MKVDFHKKVVVITGAVGGIGRQLSLRFARAGAKIVLLDVNSLQIDALKNQIEKLNTEVLGFDCDITNEQRCIEVMRDINSHFGHIDVLINNAGITHHSQFGETQLKVFRKVMDVNFFGTLNCTQAALSYLTESKGIIITMSSLAGFNPRPGRSGYSATKHALHGLFETLREEVKGQGVHIMMVCPGLTATDINKHALQGDGVVADNGLAVSGKLISPIELADGVYISATRKRELLIYSNISLWSRIFYRIFPNRHKVKMPTQYKIKAS